MFKVERVEPVYISNIRSIETKKRLLEAAGEIFAEYGYRAATVRQISQKAGANLAAINYHFGDKEGLYMAVLRSVPSAQAEKYPSNLGLAAQAGADQRLCAYVRSLIHRVFDEGRPGWHTKIMAREIVEPTRAFNTLVKEAARPLHKGLASIVRELLGSAASNESVRLCTLSIISQCVYYYHARSVIRRLYPEQKYTPDEIEKLVAHISDFSLSAIKELAQWKASRNGESRQTEGPEKLAMATRKKAQTDLPNGRSAGTRTDQAVIKNSSRHDGRKTEQLKDDRR